LLYELTEQQGQGETKLNPVSEQAIGPRTFGRRHPDDCDASVKNRDAIRHILQAPQGRALARRRPPLRHALLPHGRLGTKKGGRHPGSNSRRLQSAGHGGPQSPLRLHCVTLVVRSLRDGQIDDDQRGTSHNYNDGKLFRPLSRWCAASRRGKSKKSTARSATTTNVVAGHNEYTAGPKVFGHQIGHNNVTVADPRYLDLVTRGTAVWSNRQPTDDGKPPPQATKTREKIGAVEASHIRTHKQSRGQAQKVHAPRFLFSRRASRRVSHYPPLGFISKPPAPRLRMATISAHFIIRPRTFNSATRNSALANAQRPPRFDLQRVRIAA